MSIPSESHLIRALIEISRKMVETRALDPLLQYAVKLCMEQFGAEYGYLILLKPDLSLDYRVQMNSKGVQIEHPDEQISHTIFHEAISSGQPVLTVSAMDDPKFHRAASVVHMKLRSVLCVPLVSRGQSLGVLYLENRTLDEVFTRKHIEPLAYFASQAAAIIENAILNEQMESLIVARTAELREANAQLRHEMAERERIEKELIEIAVERERSQVVRQFIQNASHHFRTPLSIIQIALGLIQKKYALPKDDRHLEQIQDQIGSIVELLENMVLMVQLDGRKPEKVFNVLNVTYLIQAMESHWVRLVAEKQQRLSLELPTHLPFINGDAELIRQALNHLVKNAVQYTPEGGIIEVIVRSPLEDDSQTLNITVADNGSGIAQDEHDIVFQRFYRGDKAGTTRGFGLGLSIVQLITALHGGTLLLESESDKGSRFTIRLPVSEQ